MSARKSGAASPPGGVHQQSGVTALLMLFLTTAYESEELAASALARAFARAGREIIPEGQTDIVVFARRYLLEVLRLELGPALALTLVDDFLACFRDVDAPSLSEPPASTHRSVACITPPPSSKPVATRRSVLLMDPDRVRRATLARALIRAQWNVTAVDAVEQMIDALQGTVLEVAVVDLLSGWTPSIVGALAALYPKLLVIALGNKDDQAALLFEEVGLQLDVRSYDATPEELVDAISRFVDE